MMGRASGAAARLTSVWAVLSVVTLLSWAISTRTHHGVPAGSSSVITAGVLAAALVKARLILRHFMEVGTAPPWLRRVTDGWLVVLWASILALYLA